MTTLRLDYEGYCDLDLTRVGLDRYSRDPSADIFMCAYQFDDETLQHWERRYSEFPRDLKAALMDHTVTKWAFNAQFERVMTNRALKIPSPIEGWRCTQVLAYMQSFFGKLEQVGEQVGLPFDKRKMSDGKRLIQLFCMPQKVTKKQPHARRDYDTDPEDWELFCEYNKQDVVAERGIEFRCSQHPTPAVEWDYYAIDQIINDRGMPVDLTFTQNAIEFANRRRAELTAQMRDITELQNPGSVQQLLPWIRERGYPFADLNKDSVSKVLAIHNVRVAEGKPSDLDPWCVKVLQLRQWQARLSVKKFDTILNRVGPDGMLRYLFQFCGASRTARWAGRAVQTQNLTRTPPILSKSQLEPADVLTECTNIIRRGDYDLLTLFVPEVMEAVVGTVRSAFRAKPEDQFVVADLSSIETAVIAWLCQCVRLLKVLRSGRDPYKDFGQEFYQKAYDEITKDERQICKPPMLGCGYRLGGGELYDGKKTGLWGYAENMGVDMTREQAHRAVKLYRVTYPEIPEMWKVIEDAVAYVMATGKPRKVGFLTFLRRKPYLLMRLPTGRCIHYYQPRMQREIVHTGRMIVKIAKTEQDYFLHGARIGEEYEEEETYTRMGLSYMGKQQNGTKWIRIPTHGGRFMEQATQATAREVFAIGMKRAHADGFKIVGHSHDENITMTRKGDNYHTLDRLIDHMRQPIDCMPGLPLNAAGYVAPYYRKD